MLDLIFNGFSLKKRLSTENPQVVRSVSATNTLCLAKVPAISAGSAVTFNENKYIHHYVKSINNGAADCADPADTQSSKEIPVADSFRNSCGLSIEMVTCNKCVHCTLDKIGEGTVIVN